MRPLLLIAAALTMTGCTLMPEQQHERSDQQVRPSETRGETTSLLADAWQHLFDGRHDQALAKFDEVDRLTSDTSELNARARLGQALVFAAPDWPGRDLDQAAERLEGIVGDGQQPESVVVFDWILGQTVSRLVESERRQAQLEQELNATNKLSREVKEELDEVRAERAQAEETVSRLRQLIMGED